MKTMGKSFITTGIFVFVLVVSLFTVLSAQQPNQNKKPMKYWTQEEFQKWEQWNHKIQLLKPSGAADRREGVMNGNKIRTVFYNYGSVGRPNTEPSIEWPKESTHGYAYEFGPIIGAMVENVYGDSIPIFSEALIDGGDRSPAGKVWGWQPLPYSLNTNASTPAMSDDPDTWSQSQTPENPFYNQNATSEKDRFLWPGVDTIGQVSGDLESFWIMDDRDNDEFEYYPFIDDSSRRGLGLELHCRLMQFAATPAEDVIFYIIEIKNVSDKSLNKVVAGMFGDPHIGGPGDFADDMAGFDRELNMVYCWDKEGSGNDYGIPWDELGWLGFKFLESPKDSLGNELGLTSMSAPVYASTGGSPNLDDVMWEKLKPGEFSDIAQEKDNVFLFGSGYFSLDPGETQRFSIAIVMGKGFEDLRANALVAQEIYNLNYKFTKAPDPPKLTAVPADGKVTLYWDTSAEESYDDFFEAYDFEGYKIYKSTDKGQTWGSVITNAYGREVGFKPMAQYDLDNDVEGLFPIDKDGVKFYLGKNTGLVHTFVDENVINGVTYYYAVTAYDSGYVSKQVQPVESGIFEGRNMVSVMPTPRVSGYEEAKVEILHEEGLSTAILSAQILDPMIAEGFSYEVTFEDTSTGKLVANIVNTTTQQTVVEEYDELSGYPVIFEGMQFSIINEPTITIIDSLTGWAEGSQSTLNPVVSLFPSGGVRIPRDLEIRFYDTFVDTSVLVDPQPVKFDIWNINENEKMDFIFFDKTNNGIVDGGDRIVPIVYKNNAPKGTWQTEFFAPLSGDTLLPAAGDVISIYITKPLEDIDRYVINSKPHTVQPDKAKSDFLAKVAVVPNPYVVSSSYEVPPPSVFSVGRGERRIFFMNIPPQCTIRIYTTNGELIRTLEHDGTLLNGTEPWDLLTSEGLEVSYGIYIYHIDAGEYGEKVGKFAIIK